MSVCTRELSTSKDRDGKMAARTTVCARME